MALTGHILAMVDMALLVFSIIFMSTVAGKGTEVPSVDFLLLVSALCVFWLMWFGTGRSLQRKSKLETVPLWTNKIHA